MKTLPLLIVILMVTSLLAAGCKDTPKVSGMLTVHVSNQLPGGQLGEAAFAALLTWVNQQLADEGVLVTLVPLEQGKSLSDAGVVLVPEGDGPQATPSMGQVLVRVPANLDPDQFRQQVKDQVLTTFGK